MQIDSTDAQKSFVREYLRSWTFRISSWLSLALIVAFVASQRRWLLYTGMGVWLVAMLPILRRTRNRRLNLKDNADKRFLRIVAIYLAAIILCTILVLYVTHR